LFPYIFGEELIPTGIFTLAERFNFNLDNSKKQASEKFLLSFLRCAVSGIEFDRIGFLGIEHRWKRIVTRKRIKKEKKMKVVSCGDNCKMLDLKTRYDIEIPTKECCKSFLIRIKDGMLQVSAIDADGHEKPLGSLDISEGVHTEGMTTEFRDGFCTFGCRRGDEVRPRELQYSEQIRIQPIGCA